MIAGIGIDILEIEHLKRILKSGKKEFLTTVFTRKEIAYAKSKRWPENLATAFAAKEAVYKSLDPSEAGNIALKEIEILREASGKPRVCFAGVLAKNFPKTRYRIFLSLSYTEKFAAAVAVLEKI